ncbi:MAG: MotA/TolQ/ExbB proton channel family protein [Gammaproteobacteria bacterium]|jgi:small-conductance mechanosensitive channel
MHDDNYSPLYGWLLLFGLLLTGAFLLWHFGLLQQLHEQDRTSLSIVILALFVLTTLYLGWCALRLSQENRLAQKPDADAGGWAADHLRLVRQLQDSGSEQSREPLLARLVEQVHANHGSGWFISDLLLRLGLIGTVIGFVMMLGSVYDLEGDGTWALKQLLGEMGGGMQVALYTTLTGLGSAMLLSIQCHWLDRCADRLVSRIIELAATSAVATTTDG